MDWTRVAPIGTKPDAATAPRHTLKELTGWPRGRFNRELCVQLLFCASYLVLDRASSVFRAWPGTPGWYLPSGLGLTILVAGGLRYTPIFIVAAMAAVLLGGHHPLLSWTGVPGTAAGTLSFAVGAAWLKYVWHFDSKLQRLRDVGGLVLFFLVAGLPAAAMGITTAWADGRATEQTFLRGFFVWWASDAISVISFAPLLLLYVAPKVGAFLEGGKKRELTTSNLPHGLPRPEYLALVLEFASIPLIVWLVFGVRQVAPYHSLYVLFFPVIWIAVRHGICGASLGVFGVNFGVVAAAHLMHPNVGGLPELRLVMLALALAGLCVGALVSERRRMQEEALAMQKLESIGTLASGIAHDFNNLLGARDAQAELALSELEACKSCKEELEAIRKVAMRGSEIVRQVMIYAGKESAVVETVDLSKIVQEMIPLLKVSVSKHVVLSSELGQDLPLVSASGAQLRQVLLNLITNGSDAIGDRDGVIRVVTRRVDCRRKSVASPETPSGGDYICLEVSDTGCGIPLEKQAKVFDAFFTTKATGRGVGLAVVSGIVRGLGGEIHLASELGKGTTFQLLLPTAKTGASTSDILPGLDGC